MKTVYLKKIGAPLPERIKAMHSVFFLCMHCGLAFFCALKCENGGLAGKEPILKHRRPRRGMAFRVILREKGRIMSERGIFETEKDRIYYIFR